MADYSLGTAHGTVKIDSDTTGVDQANKSLDGLTRKGQDTQQALGQVGNTMGVAGLAIAGGLGVAVKTATDFEAGLSGIRAVSGASASEMDKVRSMALRIGQDTAFSASEASAAIEELVKAGIPIPDVLNGAADATVALAAATGVDMPTAAGIASNAMNVFGIQADDMDRVVNAFAQTANASAIDVTDLGMAMSQVGAVADLAGLSMEDTTMAIGQMGDAGIKGSDAGTSLKTMLMNLQPSTEAQATAMRELGLITEDGTNQFYDQNGKLKSLRDIQEILKTSTQGLTDAEKQMALETIFGSDAIRAAAVMTEGGAAAYDAFGQKMKEGGTAAEQAKIRQDNLKGSMEQFKGALEGAGITIGSILIPPLTKLVEWLTGMADKFAGLSPQMQKLITYLVAGAGGFLLLGAGIIKTVSFFSQLGGAVSTIIGALFRKNAAEAVSAASSSRTALASAGAWIAHAARMAVIWAGMAAQAVIHAAAVAAAWIAQTARAVAATAVQWATMAAQATIAALRVAAAWVLTTGASMATSLAAMAVGAARMVAQWVLMGAQAMIRAAMVAAAWLVAMGPVGWAIALLAVIVAAVIVFWDDIVKWFRTGAQQVQQWMTTAWNWIKSAWDRIVDAFKAAGQWIGQTMAYILKLIVGAWNNIVAAFANAGAAIGRAVQAAWTAVVNAWNAIIAFIRQIPGWVANVFASAASWLINAGRNIISGLANGIMNAVSWVWNSLRSITSAVTNAFSNAGSWLLSAGRAIVQGLWNGIQGLAGWLWNKVSAWASNIWDSVTSFFGISSPSKLAEWAGRMIALGLGGGIEDNARPAVSAAAGMAHQVMEGMQKVLSDGATLTAAIGTNLTAGAAASLGGATPALAGTMDSLATGSAPARAARTQAETDSEFSRIVKMEFNTYNPVAEKASDNEARKIRAAAAVGAF